MTESSESESNRRPSAVEIVLESIFTRIRTGELGPGDRLPNEQVIATENRVSRSSVREAMRTLATLGLVDIRHGDGTYVARPGRLPYFEPLLCQILLDRPSSEQLRELRMVIERGMVPLLIRNTTPDDLAALHACTTALADAAEAEAESEELSRMDLHFHEILGAATHNISVARLYNFVMQLYQPSITEAYREKHPAARGAELHYQLTEAIKKQNEHEILTTIKESVAAWGSWIQK